MDANALLIEVLKRRASDLHLKMGRPPLFRQSGELTASELPPMTPDLMRSFLGAIMDKKIADRFREDLEVDFSYHIPNRARFRVNVFLQRGQIGVVIRHIPLTVPTIEKIGLPPVLKDLAQKKQGLLLVTGPTGSGKSTTLSAIIDHINNTRHVHVITIEDPIEFVYQDNMATINQRELGVDTKALDEALKRALRQDPDIILIGELRDHATMETAIHAAETGHLVFGTLHTNDSKQTVDRLLDSFPADARTQLCKMLALNLLGVLSQRLIRRADGAGRIAAMEVLINSPHIQSILEKGATLELEKAIAKSGSFYRMQTFNQALADLVQKGLIAKSEALANSFNPDDLNLLLRGIGGAKVEAVESGAPGPGGIMPPAPVAEPEPSPAPAPAPAPKKGDDPFKKLKVTRGFQF